MTNRTLIGGGCVAAVMAVTVATHWLCVHNEFLNWDDQSYLDQVMEHRPLSLTTVRWAFTSTWIYYQPLTWLSHALDCRFWGLDSARHHATGVVLHGLNTALVMAFVWMLTQTLAAISGRERAGMAIGTGLVFGIHPLQVESVAWLAERNNLLCGGFILATLCAYVRATSGVAADIRRRPGQSVTNDLRLFTSAATTDGRWWWATTALFAAALLSKPMAVPLPVAMLALDFFPLRRHTATNWWALVREKLPLFLMSSAVAAVTVFAAVAHEEGMKGLGEFGLIMRCLLAARSVAFYAWKLVWPGWLSPFYPLDHWISAAQWDLWAAALAVIITTAAFVALRNRWPGLLAAWGAFIAMILPVSGIAQAGAQIAADRYLYVALVPLMLMVMAGVVLVWRKARLMVRVALAVLLGCYLAFLGYRTRGQIAVWHTDETLWREVLKHYPNSWVPNHQLAANLIAQRKFDEALIYANRALTITPHNAFELAVVGYLHLILGRPAEAERALVQSLRQDLRSGKGWYYLACARSQLGKSELALECLRRALALDPSFAASARTDPALAPLRDDPRSAGRFRDLVDAKS